MHKVDILGQLPPLFHIVYSVSFEALIVGFSFLTFDTRKIGLSLIPLKKLMGHFMSLLCGRRLKINLLQTAHTEFPSWPSVDYFPSVQCV